MSSTTIFIGNDRPPCFGSRRDLVASAVNCSRCGHKGSCFSVVNSVFKAVAAGQLPTNDYMIGERRALQEQHRNACLHYGEDAVEEFSLSIVREYHERVFPERTAEEIQTSQTAAELIDSLADIDADASSGSPLIEAAVVESDPVVQADRKPMIVYVGSSDGPIATVKNAGAPTTVEAPTYQFIGLGHGISYAALSNEELEGALVLLCQQTTRRYSGPQPYLVLRERYCAANIELNLRGLLPPRFRATCRGEKWVPGKAWSAGMKAMSNDMKIIDLHWLHSTGVRSHVKDNEFQDLFAQEEFDFELASRFVAKNWKSETRAIRILLLADVEQWQLKKLVSAEVNTRWQQVLDDARTVERRLKSVACRRPLLASEVVDFTRLWIADTICDGTCQALIGKVHGWMKGAPPLAPSTLCSKLKRMRHWTT